VINGCDDLQAGDIFTWENYPLFVNEQKARRWFLFLGHRFLESIVYQVTTTTQFDHYKENGNRINNLALKGRGMLFLLRYRTVGLIPLYRPKVACKQVRNMQGIKPSPRIKRLTPNKLISLQILK
jgi:hypothetical protein